MQHPGQEIQLGVWVSSKLGHNRHYPGPWPWVGGVVPLWRRRGGWILLSNAQARAKLLEQVFSRGGTCAAVAVSKKGGRWLGTLGPLGASRVAVQLVTARGMNPTGHGCVVARRYI